MGLNGPRRGERSSVLHRSPCLPPQVLPAPASQSTGHSGAQQCAKEYDWRTGRTYNRICDHSAGDSLCWTKAREESVSFSKT